MLVPRRQDPEKAHLRAAYPWHLHTHAGDPVRKRVRKAVQRWKWRRRFVPQLAREQRFRVRGADAPRTRERPHSMSPAPPVDPAPIPAQAHSERRTPPPPTRLGAPDSLAG